VYHSGPVGAALTARNGRISGVAVSQAVASFGVEGQGWDEMLIGQRWDTAAEVASVVVGSLVADLPEEPVVLNVNVPNLPLEELVGWRHTEVGTIPPRALARATMTPRVGHTNTFDVAMEWGEPIELPADTDGGAVERGEVSITYLSRISAGPTDTPLAQRTSAALDAFLR